MRSGVAASPADDEMRVRTWVGTDVPIGHQSPSPKAVGDNGPDRNGGFHPPPTVPGVTPYSVISTLTGSPCALSGATQT